MELVRLRLAGGAKPCYAAKMLEGLPPNNAAHRLTLVTDERRARAVADLIVESFEPAEAASAAFETEDAWPGGGKAWLVEAYFGFEPDEDELRALSPPPRTKRPRQPRRLRPYREERLGRQCARRPRAGPRRALPGPRRARPRKGPAERRRHRDRGRPRLRHRPSRHDARLPPAFRPAAEAPPPASRARRRLRRGRARHRRGEGLERKVWLGDIDPVAVEVANDNARLNGVGAFCKAIVSRGVENRALARGRALRRRLRQHSRQAPAAARALARRRHRRPTATPSSPACCSPTSPACSPPGGRRAFTRRADRPRGLGEPQAEAQMSGGGDSCPDVRRPSRPHSTRARATTTRRPMAPSRSQPAAGADRRGRALVRPDDAPPARPRACSKSAAPPAATSSRWRPPGPRPALSASTFLPSRSRRGPPRIDRAGADQHRPRRPQLRHDRTPPKASSTSSFATASTAGSRSRSAMAPRVIWPSALAPDGVATASFNVLPGWRPLQIARDSLLVHARLKNDPASRSDRGARAFERLAAESKAAPPTADSGARKRAGSRQATTPTSHTKSSRRTTTRSRSWIFAPRSTVTTWPMSANARCPPITRTPWRPPPRRASARWPGATTAPANNI